ncbi:putative 1-phosphatidylinositol-3-phosphate 5-kinase FAB1C isoform X2 [Malania oleifera]|uniref:putative 1-phosphatidylinositol-3-phosphate 5-kinase FAB1C isoform X2 n=1 Tax=Malania oleifera TaxID=397392 RepID=UPI0025AEA094|nr:putative 1-phosphatidylinositol-3-phosphate 5-kinase FAB1C isoform X2 [Malania oleifera]
MGIPDSSLLNLINKVRSWISWGRRDLSCLSDKFEMSFNSSIMCCECEKTFSEFYQRYCCQKCGRVLCGKCIGGYPSPVVAASDAMKREAVNGQYIKSCKFCSRVSVRHGGGRRYGDKIYPSASPRGSSEPPSPCFSGEKFDADVSNEPIQGDRVDCFLGAQEDGYFHNEVTGSSFSASNSFRCSFTRSDEEEADESAKHFFRSSSEYCYDILDIDSSNVSGRHEFYSFKSVDSSPSESPSRIRFTSQGVGHSVQQEREGSPMCQNDAPFNSDTQAVLKKPEIEIQDPENTDDCPDDLSIFRNQYEHLQKLLDFEKNGCIWFPPPPDDEDEGNFFAYDDEDDDIGESGAMFSSSGTFPRMFPLKEKHNEVNREPLRAVVQGHFRALVSQLLQAEGVNMGKDCIEDWLNIVTTIAWQAANFVKPDTTGGGSMDPGDYVKVKCVASGRPSDSILVKGVVCTKNIKHKRMISQYKNPRLILLGGALEYQRVPNQLASLDTLLQQEINHLKTIVSKIEGRRPNVLLVEKSVSSYAQEYLLAKEISLVLNVKRPLLERIARCTGALITPSIDHIPTTQLGHCELFRVERVLEEFEPANLSNKRPSKTLMFFEGCPRRLGCTVLLKGACHEELKKVKHVVQYAVFAAHHLSLETSFLADEGASLPRITLKPSITIPERIAIDNAISIISNSSVSAFQAVTDLSDQSEGCEDLNLELRGWDSSSEHFNPCHLPPFPVSMDCRVKGVNILCDAHRDDSVSKPELLESMAEEGRQSEEINELARPERIDENELSAEYFSAADSHQSILVSFSSHCLKGTVCERSRLLRIKFYGSFDKPLGRYLRDDLLDQTSYCRVCYEPAEAHVQCYTHQQGSLTINVRRLPSLNLPGERDGKIWMWHRCLKCAPKDGVPPATRRVVMSDAAWGLSFGKFLELSFSNHATANRIANCGHSLQRDCLRYYGFGGMVAFFRYSPIDILSVHLPASVLEFNGFAQQKWIRKEAAELMSKMETLYVEISDALYNFEQKATEYEPSDASEFEDHIMVLRDLLKKERNDYNVLLQSATLETSQSGQVAVDVLELNRLRRSLLIGSHVWDNRLCLLDSLLKTRSSIFNVTQGNVSDAELQESKRDLYLNDGKHDCSPGESLSESLNLKLQESPQNDLQLLEDPDLPLLEPFAPQDSMSAASCHKKQEEMHSDGDASVNKTFFESVPCPEPNLSDKIDSAWTGTDQLPVKVQSPCMVQADGPQTGPGTKINQIDTSPFKRLISPVRVYSFDSAVRVQERIRKGLLPSMHLSTVRSFHASGDYKSMVRDPVSNILRTNSPTLPREDQKLSFIHNSAPLHISCASHIAEGVRLLLPPVGHDNLVIAVYDDEPTSIISYALSSKNYEDWVANKSNEHERNWSAHDGSREDSASYSFTAWQSFGSLDLDYMHCGSYGSEDASSSIGNLSIYPKKSPHLRISFGDNYSITGGRMKFSVTCYFAKQFDALRKKCCPSEVDFVRSLSRCKTWRAEGGKSKVYFARSLDERFIIKQVTKTELDSFEEFAPEYFKYLTDSLDSGSPTCLAKILGIYQVTVKYLKGGKETKMDLMVMENLFFKRCISRVYDLKGSARSRYNPDTTGKNKVLLDMNLLETLRTKPIFLGSKAKRRLERAVWNDTSFLASVDVMDYSLLVGVDEERKELVLGIIDFMRQYTWDKHLETWVKASGILGGPKNASPTIISPDQYKRRFRKAMTTYFLTVPDQWPS